MKRTGSIKRVARKIGGGDEEENDASTADQTQENVVKRPPLSKKKGSKLRMSIGASGDDEDEAITPRKSLGRRAIERSAELRAGQEDKPSYSKDFLAELKQSTPSTPKDVSSHATSEDEAHAQSLDLASKFGTSISKAKEGTAIPTQAEIQEKKERRARLAQEKDFVSLNASDSEEERKELLLRPKEKYAETRLVRDDEDLAEGFDDYVEDGKIALGRKAEREEKRRKRKEMEELINQAEGADDEEDEDNDSEVERNEAYEAAQTRAGTYGQHRTPNGEELARPRTPPKITPIPELGSVIAKMRAGLGEMKAMKEAKERKLAELEAEKKEIAERELWIQAQLKEVGARYEKLRAEAGMTGEPSVNGNGLPVERGLESFGGTPAPTTPAAITPGMGTPMIVSDEG